MKSHNKSRLLVTFGLLLSIAIMLLVGSTIVSAEEIPTYKVNTPAELKVQCLNNNTYCSPTAVCNLTVTGLRGVTIVNNVRMTNNITYHNYTLPASKTIDQGLYSANVICLDGSVNTQPVSWYFRITPSGLFDVLGYFIIAFVVAYLIAFFGYFGKNEWIAVAGGLAMISLGIYTLNNGIDIYRTVITETISWWTIAVGAIIALHAGASLIEENM